MTDPVDGGRRPVRLLFLVALLGVVALMLLALLVVRVGPEIVDNLVGAVA